MGQCSLALSQTVTTIGDRTLELWLEMIREDLKFRSLSTQLH